MEADQRGLTSIGQGTPDRATKSMPFNPTRPNSRVTASAMALARSRTSCSAGNSSPPPTRLPQYRNPPAPNLRSPTICRVRASGSALLPSARNTSEPGIPGMRSCRY